MQALLESLLFASLKPQRSRSVDRVNTALINENSVLIMRTIHSSIRSATHSPSFWLFGLILLAALASNLTAGDGGSPASPSATGRKEVSKVMREGSRLESKLMTIRLAGESIVLESDDHQTFEALENLSLERIMQAVRADSGDNNWIISGQVTEFRGKNYILLDRVSRAPRVR